MPLNLFQDKSILHIKKILIIFTILPSLYLSAPVSPLSAPLFSLSINNIYLPLFSDYTYILSISFYSPSLSISTCSSLTLFKKSCVPSFLSLNCEQMTVTEKCKCPYLCMPVLCPGTENMEELSERRFRS